MKFGVVIFPGSNCDHDIIYVLKNILKQEVVKLWHKDKSLQGSILLYFPVVFLLAIIYVLRSNCKVFTHYGKCDRICK